MQYIMSQGEYDMLNDKARDTEDRLNVIILELCTRLCDNMQMFRGSQEPLAYGCIRTKGYGTCGSCPVNTQCPYDKKRFSK